MTNPTLKISSIITVSNEVLNDAVDINGTGMGPYIFTLPKPLTTEEREASAAASRARAVEAQAPIIADHLAALEAADPKVRPFLELHEPKFYEYGTYAHCGGCDLSGYHEDDPDFPCSTYLLALNGQ